jgi:hypothetical protein
LIGNADAGSAAAARLALALENVVRCAPSKRTSGRLLGAIAIREHESTRSVDEGGQVRRGTGGSPRRDAREEEGLGAVQISEAGQVPLIEQRGPDLAVGSAA